MYPICRHTNIEGAACSQVRGVFREAVKFKLKRDGRLSTLLKQLGKRPVFVFFFFPSLLSLSLLFSQNKRLLLNFKLEICLFGAFALTESKKIL